MTKRRDIVDPRQPRPRLADREQLQGDPFAPRSVAQHDDRRPVPLRLLGFGLFCLAAFGALALNLYALQVREGNRYASLAEGNLVRQLVVPAPRGVIFDRHGVQLVQNRGSFDVAVVPFDLPHGAARATLLQRLQKMIGISPDEVERQVRRHATEPFQPLVLKQNLDPTTYQVLTENIPTMPGVQIVTGTSRVYLQGLQGTALGHILGFVGKLDPDEYKALREKGYRLDDQVGKTGLEYSDENWLRGENGVSVVEVDAHGNLVRTISRTQPVPGDNVYLSIDLGLQQEAVKDLQAAMDQAHKELGGNHAQAGSAIVVNPQTGEVYAMVSLPDYDINMFANGITVAQYQALVDDPRKPLLDRSIDGQYPPGSTFKLVTGAAALQSGAINQSSTIFCPGFLNVAGFRFGCWLGSGHGSQNVVQAIAHSCDVFFYTVADRMGDLVLNKFAKDFGVGRKTGIDLANEAKGIAPDRDWKKAYFQEALQETGDQAWGDDTWYEGNTVTYGIGQSFLLTTPLQDLMWTSTVANGGNYLRPQLTHRVTAAEDGHPVHPFGPIKDHTVSVDPRYLAIIRDGLLAAADRGGTSGFIWQQAAFRNVPSPSGKTGTAQYGAPDAKGNYSTHAWYTAYAPAVDPEVAIVVFVEGGGEGHQAAAPVAAQILSYYFAHRNQIRAQ